MTTPSPSQPVTQGLLPCPNPWCASHNRSDPELFEAHKPIVTPLPGEAFAVCCPVCPISGAWKDSAAEAIAAWNTRLATSADQREAGPVADAVADALASVSVAYTHVTLTDMTTAGRSWKVHETGHGDPFVRDAWLGEFDNKAEANALAAKLRRERAVDAVRAALSSTGTTGETGERHPDDVAVDRFAAKMKAKLALAREKGRGGWDDPEQCSPAILLPMFHDHVAKGDPVDVANFAMMLDHYGASTAARVKCDRPGCDWFDGRALPLPATPEPTTPGVEACSCAEVAGEDPRCVLHGRGTLWAKENPDICQIADELAGSREALSDLVDALDRGIMEESENYVVSLAAARAALGTGESEA